jgi:hypothetical protein
MWQELGYHGNGTMTFDGINLNDNIVGFYLDSRGNTPPRPATCLQRPAPVTQKVADSRVSSGP